MAQWKNMSAWGEGRSRLRLAVDRGPSDELRIRDDHEGPDSSEHLDGGIPTVRGGAGSRGLRPQSASDHGRASRSSPERLVAIFHCRTVEESVVALAPTMRCSVLVSPLEGASPSDG